MFFSIKTQSKWFPSDEGPFWQYCWVLLFSAQGFFNLLSFSELLPYSWERDRKLFKCRAAKLLSRAISGPLILEVLDEGDTMWPLTCFISEGLAANSWHTAHSNLYSDFYQVKNFKTTCQFLGRKCESCRKLANWFPKVSEKQSLG